MDYDLTFGKIGGELVLYENIGTPATPSWQQNNDVVSGIEVPQNSTPAFADLDNDGKMDLIIGEYSGNFSFYKNLVPTSVSSDIGTVPPAFGLKQNYPNPFNPATTIQFSMPGSGFVSLTVYDILGKEVARLFAGVFSSGKHSIEWNASQLSSGIYFYRLRFGTSVETKKMILMK